MASLPAWPPTTRGRACRISVSVVAVEALMNNAGSTENFNKP